MSGTMPRLELRSDTVTLHVLDTKRFTGNLTPSENLIQPCISLRNSMPASSGVLHHPRYLVYSTSRNAWNNGAQGGLEFELALGPANVSQMCTYSCYKGADMSLTTSAVVPCPRLALFCVKIISHFFRTWSLTWPYRSFLLLR